jgi:hypothetical protein
MTWKPQQQQQQSDSNARQKEIPCAMIKAFDIKAVGNKCHSAGLTGLRRVNFFSFNQPTKQALRKIDAHTHS